MKHFLISRFNINHLHYVSHDIDLVLSKEWLNYRLEVFYKYTYPTVSIQTNTNFNWIVLFDYRTCQEFLQNFISLDKFNICKILLVGDSNYLNVIQDYVKSKIEIKDKHIISTTLDTDDGLLPEFIEQIQSTYIKEENRVPFGINLSNGFIVNSGTGIFYSKSFLSNPFYSLIELKSDFLSVCFYPHHLLAKNFFTINIKSRYFWLQNIHKSNFGNIVKGSPMLSLKIVPNEISSLYLKPKLFSFINALSNYFFFRLRNLFIKIQNFFR